MSDETLDGLAESFVKSWRDGQHPTIEEYAGRNPDLAAEIRALFPALVALEKAAPPDAAEPALAGDLGEYRIVREVGRGGMGVVYEAEQTTLRRRVALKVLPRQACRDARLLDRFRREAQAAARLHHTNIVPVYGIGEHAGIHFYTMQFVHGQPMSQVIAELRRIRHGDAPSAIGGILGLGREDGDGPFFHGVARLGKQVAEALAYAHAQGVIHRDIKPSNLMLDAEGVVWVTDFGLARADGASDLTGTGDMLGTLAYMAPERFRGWSDPRSDVYSLGLTLYELLSLRPAFFEADMNRLIARITESDLPPLRRRRRNIPRDLETVVLRAVARDPADRYQTAAEMAKDLGRFLADRPVRAQRASTLRRLRGWCRRNPLAAALSALVLVLLVTVAGVSGTAAALRRAERDTAVENLARAEAAEARLREELRSSQVAQARALRVSKRPGQRFEALDRLAEAARIRPSEDLRNDVIATLAQLDVRTLRRWTKGEEDKAQALDPVGRRYASGRKDGSITLHRIPDGGETLRLPSPGGGPATAACFSPDGRLLGTLYGKETPAVFRVWDLESATVVAEEPCGAWPGTVDADRRGHAAVVAPDGAIRILDLARRTRKTVPDTGPSRPDRLRWSADGSLLAAGAGGHTVRILDPERGVVRTLEFPATVFDLAWHPRVRRLAVAAGTEVRIVDVADGRLVRVLQGHHGIVSDVAYDASGSLIASGSWDRRTVLWDAATGEQHLVLPRFSRLTGSYLRGSAGNDQGWLDEIVGSPCVRMIDEHTMGAGPVAVAFSPDRRVLAISSTDRVRLWDSAHLEEIASLPLSGVLLVAFAGSGEMITATRERILSWPLAHHADEGLLVIGPPKVLYEGAAPAGDEDPFPSSRDVRFLRTAQGAVGPVPLVVAERGDLPYIALSADGRWAATRVWLAEQMHVWDLDSRRCVHSFAAHNAQAAFTPDGKHLVVNPLYGPCTIHETTSWSVVREFESDPAGITVSRDGTVLAAAERSSGVALFRLPDLAPLASLQTEGALSPDHLRFSPEGDRLAVTQSHRVQIWDLGLMRDELDRLGLGGGLPAWPAPGPAPDAAPLRADVLLGALAPEDAPPARAPTATSK